MNISSLFNSNNYISRYSNLTKLLSQSQLYQGQPQQYTGAVSGLSKNLSYLLDQKIQTDFSQLAKKAQGIEANQPANAFLRAGATAVSSNSNVVAATAKNSAVQGSYNLEVSQIAKAQENTGDWLGAAGKNLANGAIQNFAIEMKGKSGFVTKTANFTIDTKAGESNKDLLTKMAGAINSKSQDLGIKAKVETSTVNGVEKARLVVNGAQTGTNSSNFTIKDTTGNLVAGTKINNVTTNAQNAKYKLNGYANESQTNEITLDWRKQVNATLKNTTSPGAAVKINVKAADQNAIYNDVKGFVNQYNKTIKDLGQFSTNKLAVTQIAASDRSKLAAAGITINRDNTLSIDENRFKTGLTYNADKVQETIGGTNGFAAKVAAKVKEIDYNDLINNQVLSKKYQPGTILDYFM